MSDSVVTKLNTNLPFNDSFESQVEQTNFMIAILKDDSLTNLVNSEIMHYIYDAIVRIIDLIKLIDKKEPNKIVSAPIIEGLYTKISDLLNLSIDKLSILHPQLNDDFIHIFNNMSQRIKMDTHLMKNRKDQKKIETAELLIQNIYNTSGLIMDWYKMLMAMVFRISVKNINRTEFETLICECAKIHGVFLDIEISPEINLMRIKSNSLNLFIALFEIMNNINKYGGGKAKVIVSSSPHGAITFNAVNRKIKNDLPVFSSGKGINSLKELGFLNKIINNDENFKILIYIGNIIPILAPIEA